MNTTTRTIILLLTFGCLFSACKDDNFPPLKSFDSYYPIEVGHESIYLVDSIFYDDFNDTIFTHSSRLREVVDTIFETQDAQGNTQIEFVSYLYSETLPNVWQYIATYSTRKNAQRVERTENNQNFIKMVFPVVDEKTWQGNALTNLAPWTYQYQETHLSKTFNGINYDSTLVVKQAEENNFIQELLSLEIYAKDIGMVYKEFTDIETQQGVQSGLTLKITLESYKR